MATCGNPTGAVDLIAGWCNAKTRNSAREVSPKVAHCSSAILHFVVLGGENHIHGRFLIFHRILKARMSQEKVKNATEDTLPRSGCGNGLVLERHLNKGLSKVHGNLSVGKHASPPKLSVSVCAQESCEEIQYHCWICFIFSTKGCTNTCLIRMWHHCNSPPKNAVTQPPWHASDNCTWHPRHLNQLEPSDAELEPTATDYSAPLVLCDPLTPLPCHLGSPGNAAVSKSAMGESKMNAPSGQASVHILA